MTDDCVYEKPDASTVISGIPWAARLDDLFCPFFQDIKWKGGIRTRVDSGSFGCSSSLSASWGGTRSKPDTEPRVTKIGQIWSKFHQNSFKKPLFPVASRLLSVALRKHGHPGVRCSSRSSTYAPDLHEDSVGHRLTQGRRKGDPSEAGSRATSKPHGWVIPTPGEAGIG